MLMVTMGIYAFLQFTNIRVITVRVIYELKISDQYSYAVNNYGKGQDVWKKDGNLQFDKGNGRKVI